MAEASSRRAAGGGKHRRRRRSVMSEINVTPFVDVMLVLLIVFMVSAPLLTVGVPIELPQSQAKSLSQDNEPLTVSVECRGQGFSARQRNHSRRSGAETQGDHRRPRQLETSRSMCAAIRRSTYGTMMRVMGHLSSAGYHQVALVTEVEQGGG